MYNNIGMDPVEYASAMEAMIREGMSMKDAHTSLRTLHTRLDPDKPETHNLGTSSLHMQEGAAQFVREMADLSMVKVETDADPAGPYDHCPQSVRIGARTWKVRWYPHNKWLEEKLDEGNKGLTEVANSNIYLRTSRLYSDSGVEVQYDWQSLAETFLHECLHAMLWDTSLDRYPRSPQGKWDQEEYTVVQLAPRLQAFLLDNPDALAWVKDSATA
jgi:hypothetical protein